VTLRWLMAGLVGLISPALAIASEPPVVELVPAPPLEVTAPVYPGDDEALLPPDYPEPPAHVAERFVREGIVYDGFRTGELEYLKGFFPDASEEERAQYAELKAWYKQCAGQGNARLSTEMAEFGITLIEGKFNGAAPMCQQVVFGNQGLLDRFATYEEFAKAARTARLVFDGLIQGIDTAEGLYAATRFRDILDEIDYFSMRFHVLLGASHWGQTEGITGRTLNPDRPPKMTDKERYVFGAFLESEYVRLQFARTKWLEEIVARHGWPNETNSTSAGAGNARLMVWQGDHDPAFQLRMLRVMEATVAAGGIDNWEFAEAYDGVMLKLTGKQRYGTHVFCGKNEAIERLDDPDKLDAWRQEIGMESIGDYSGYIRTECEYVD
jgi:Family of unknown function (DUF6624)